MKGLQGIADAPKSEVNEFNVLENLYCWYIFLNISTTDFFL